MSLTDRHILNGFNIFLESAVSIDRTVFRIILLMLHTPVNIISVMLGHRSTQKVGERNVKYSLGMMMKGK